MGRLAGNFDDGDFRQPPDEKRLIGQFNDENEETRRLADGVKGEFDGILERMQDPEVRAGIDAGFRRRPGLTGEVPKKAGSVALSTSAAKPAPKRA